MIQPIPSTANIIIPYRYLEQALAVGSKNISPVGQTETSNAIQQSSSSENDTAYNQQRENYLPRPLIDPSLYVDFECDH